MKHEEVTGQYLFTGWGALRASPSDSEMVKKWLDLKFASQLFERNRANFSSDEHVEMRKNYTVTLHENQKK